MAYGTLVALVPPVHKHFWAKTYKGTILTTGHPMVSRFTLAVVTQVQLPIGAVIAAGGTNLPWLNNFLKGTAPYLTKGQYLYILWL
jgi:hypothetical protein